MGAPSDAQIDEAIAWGLANRWSEARIVRHLASLERMSDEELAAVGVYPPSGRGEASPSMSRPDRLLRKNAIHRIPHQR